MLWEIYQQSEINSAKFDASRAESKADDVRTDMRRLEDKLDSLALTCQALWELLRTQTGWTDEQLVDKMREVDLRDGREDGKMGSGGAPCPKCGRMLNRRRTQCMYCGERVDKEHVFQS